MIMVFAGLVLYLLGFASGEKVSVDAIYISASIYTVGALLSFRRRDS